MPIVRLFILSCLWAWSAAWANSTPVAYNVPVAPWTFPDQPERGVAPEYLRYLFDTAGVPIRLDVKPYLRVISGLRDGSNAAAMLIPDSERDLYALRLCEVTSLRAGVLYKKSRHGRLSTAELSGLRVGIPRGTHALDKLSTVPGVQAYPIDSIEQGLMMLRADRLDATFLSSPGSEGLAQEGGMSAPEYGWLDVDGAPVVVYISRKSGLARDAAALQRLRGVCGGSGRAVMDQLLRKYR